MSQSGYKATDLSGYGSDIRSRDARACVRSTKTTAKKTTVTTV